MRLLYCNSEGAFSFTKYFVGDDKIPPYAILSHTWEDGQEVTFQDIESRVVQNKSGYDKIRFCSQEAKRDGLQYFWVDTCCIDKSNQVELQEAITSMFRWYQEAAKCYVYLSDISTADWNKDDSSKYTWKTAFQTSTWFTRGWTLQELLAPRFVEFFSKEGKQLGNKRSLERQLQKRTGIAIPALRGTPLHTFSVKERLSWAKDRKTTRKEDKAYSLFGIFDIYISVIYGEGEHNAFRRLQNEIELHCNSFSYDGSDSELDNEDSAAPPGPEISIARHSPAPIQQELKVQSKEAEMVEIAPSAQSPSWLKPIVRMPSSVLVANMRKLDPSMHAQFTEMIFSNCRRACFGFYREKRLWQTKYSNQDVDEPKLFQLDNGKFPKDEGDLSLRDWLLKLKHAYSRILEADSFSKVDIYDPSGARAGLWPGLPRILLLVDPWGGLNIENVEECLLLGIRLCRHRNELDSFSRLTVVWKELHKHSADVEETGFRLDLKNLMPPPEKLHSTELAESSVIPSKRSSDTAFL